MVHEIHSHIGRGNGGFALQLLTSRVNHEREEDAGEMIKSLPKRVFLNLKFWPLPTGRLT
jgi:hypothetical protein